MQEYCKTKNEKDHLIKIKKTAKFGHALYDSEEKITEDNIDVLELCKSLEFSDYFNKNIDNLPDNISEISLGIMFNQDINKLPKKLKTLNIRSCYGKNICFDNCEIKNFNVDENYDSFEKFKYDDRMKIKLTKALCFPKRNNTEILVKNIERAFKVKTIKNIKLNLSKDFYVLSNKNCMNNLSKNIEILHLNFIKKEQSRFNFIFDDILPKIKTKIKINNLNNKLKNFESLSEDILNILSFPSSLEEININFDINCNKILNNKMKKMQICMKKKYLKLPIKIFHVKITYNTFLTSNFLNLRKNKNLKYLNIHSLNISRITLKTKNNHINKIEFNGSCLSIEDDSQLFYKKNKPLIKLNDYSKYKKQILNKSKDCFMTVDGNIKNKSEAINKYIDKLINEKNTKIEVLSVTADEYFDCEADTNIRIGKIFFCSNVDNFMRKMPSYHSYHLKKEFMEKNDLINLKNVNIKEMILNVFCSENKRNTFNRTINYLPRTLKEFKCKNNDILEECKILLIVWSIKFKNLLIDESEKENIKYSIVDLMVELCKFNDEYESKKDENCDLFKKKCPFDENSKKIFLESNDNICWIYKNSDEKKTCYVDYFKYLFITDKKKIELDIVKLEKDLEKLFEKESKDSRKLIKILTISEELYSVNKIFDDKYCKIRYQKFYNKIFEIKKKYMSL